MSTRQFFQEAYYVNSIDEAAQRWSRVFGAGPFFAARHHRCPEFSYRGTPQQADVSYAFGYLGDLMIQFIEQHDETPSIYLDLFPRGREGFHHTAFLVHDFAAERQRMIDLGFPLACELWADEVNAAYFETRELNGGYTEIHGDPAHILATFALWRRAHQLRGADTPAILEFENLPAYRRAPLL